jgi:putative transposase
VKNGGERPALRLERAELIIAEKSLKTPGDSAEEPRRRREELMLSVNQLALVIGVVMACAAFGVCRATWYRRRSPNRARLARRAPARALSVAERERVLSTLNSDRFVDQPPAEVYAMLLDEEETYLCSTRTMYRILASAKQIRERRNQLRHPNYRPPQLLATAPNQVWTWDITLTRQPLRRGLDARRERRFNRLIEICRNQDIEPLNSPSDRSPAMTSQSLALLFGRLRSAQPHRPHVSDNPFSR